MGRLGKAEGWRGKETERKRNVHIKRMKGRRQDRGQTELKQPRQPAASVINNVSTV